MKKMDSQIICQFWQDVATGKVTRYDFSNSEHRLAYYDALGTDEASLRNECPHLYRLIANCFVLSEEEGAMGFTTATKSHLNLEGHHNGMIGNSETNYTQKKSYILMNSKLINTSSPEMPEVCANPYAIGSNIVQLENLTLFLPFRPHVVEEFQLQNTSTSFRQDGSMEDPIPFVSANMIYDNADVVQRIEIDKPAKIKSKKYSDCCLIVYNRHAESGDIPDDEFPNVIVDKSKETKVINYHQGFAGRIILTNDWVFEYDNWPASGIHISVKLTDEEIGGEIQYNGIDNIKKLFKLKCSNVLEWNFKVSETETYENWKTELLAKHVTNDAKLAFWASIPISIKPKGSDPDAIPNTTTVTIKSTYPFEDPSKYPSSKQIWYIWIWWGCLGKDTFITLYNGSIVPISEIKSGDIVETESGSSEVISVYKGYEKEVIYLETDAEESLFVSSDHPIMTKRGLIRAEDLNAGDRVKTLNGFIGLKSLYRRDYCDDVYGLQFAENALLYCNGILTGDFGTQQMETKEQDQCVSPVIFDKNNKAALDLLKLNLWNSASSKEQDAFNANRIDTSTTLCTACSMLYQEDCLQLSLETADVKWDSKNLEFSLDFWAKICGQSRSMVSQEQGFQFGVDGDTLVFTIPGKDEVNVTLTTPIGNDWHHYAMIFDGIQLFLALDGIIIGESRNFSDSPILRGEDPLIFGAGFTGHMQKAVLYQRAVSIDKIRNRMFQYICSQDDKDIFAFLDMSFNTISDIGANKLSVASLGTCSVRNLITGYRPSVGSYAGLENYPKINPGGFGSKSFGIYIRFYSDFLNNTKGVLLSNGYIGKVDSVALFLEKKGSDLLDISMALGSEVLVIAESVPRFCWIDFAVSYIYSEGELVSYLNGQKIQTLSVGQFERSTSGRTIIGNGFSEDEGTTDYTCDCCYSVVAIFDNAIYEEQVEQLTEQPPYLFDKKLAALYHFEHQPPTELVSGQKISLALNDQSTYENTIRQITNKRCHYHIETEVKEYDKDAVKLYKILGIYYYEMFGISPGCILNQEILDAVYTYLTQSLLCIPEIKQLFHTKKVTDEMLARLLTNLDGSVTSAFLRLIYATNTKTEQTSDWNAKLCCNNVCSKAHTLASIGHYAAFYCRSESFLKEIFAHLRTALENLAL